jgi:putative ABC transport system substrate-binding protein
MKKLAGGIMCWALILVTAVAAEPKKIYVILWEGCEHACQGFVKGIEESGFDAEIFLRDADQDKSKFARFILEARDMNVDLVSTYGTSVTLGVAGNRDTATDMRFVNDIPLVFWYVSDPFGTNIAAGFDASGRANVTGTYNRVPEQVNIKAIKSFLPEFKSLGMVFNGNEKNSVNKVAEMKLISEEMGFTLVALEIDPGNKTVPDSSLIRGKIKELAEAGVDFIYLGSSSFLRLNGEAFTAAAVDFGLPILSPYEELVREEKALFSIAARAEDVGRMAAKQVLKVLRDGQSPGDIPIARIIDFAYVVNMEVAQKLNIFPPMDVLRVAEIVR